jgi:hypothetical protein
MLRRSSTAAGVLALGFVCALAVPASARFSLYDFEGLTAGVTIYGQDNWGTVWPPDWDVYGNGTVQSGYGINPTKMYSAGGFSRVNNGAWKYSVSPTEKDFLIQVDVTWLGGAYFGVGYDGNADNNITETGEWPGYMYASGDIELGVQGGYVISGALPATYNGGDWIRILLSFDWTATGPGVYGKVSAYSLNLTDGETALAPVPGLQNVAITRAAWGTWLANASADPMHAGIWARGTVRLDNFGVGTLPEPGSVALLLLGGAGLLCRRR